MLSRTIGYERGRTGEAPEAGRRATMLALVCLAAAGFYYAFLISRGAPFFLAPVPHGLTYNSMLLHLLHGSFDVDPATIGDEGSLRNGLVYTYFGIVPALLRLVLLPLPDFATTDFTRLGCLAAVTLMAGFKLASLRVVWRAAGTRGRSILLTLFTIAILASGPQIQFLRASIYQEAVFWAGAWAAGFVYLVLRGYFSEWGFTPGLLSLLALLAGTCLLTRVSTGLGLYLAFGLLWLRLGWHGLRVAAPLRACFGVLAPLWAPLAICFGFAAVAGLINFERWGNPLLFADPRLYLWPKLHAPDRFLRVERYGDFNFVRLGYGLLYYFFPIWAMRGADGELLWSAFQQRTIDAVELPPSSLFLSDPLIVGLAIYALVQLLGRGVAIRRDIAVPVLIGLAVPGLLMLIAISMAFRYRLEFYPFLEFAAFLGFGALLSRRQAPPLLPFAAATIGGVVTAHLLWVLYMLTPFGTATTVLNGMDVVSYYRSWLQL